MFNLANDQLEVALIDPCTDRTLLGARYCAGGYIHQITDRHLGPLLAGPTYPDRFEVFHGQGIPDAFNLSPLREVGSPDEAAIIGVGKVRLHRDYRQNAVLRSDPWECRIAPASAQMSVRHRHGPWACVLNRELRLDGRTLLSRLLLRNEGEDAIPLRWFPHPFFPQPEDPTLCRFNLALRLAPENPGYRLGADGWIARAASPDQGGFFLALDHSAQNPLEIQQRHPAVGIIAASCSYVPAYLPIWGNDRTFSWEPFLEHTVGPGQEFAWSIAYTF